MRTRFVIVLPLLAAMLTAAADEQDDVPVYDVELVIFRHVRPLISSEQWSAQTMGANLVGALDFAQPEAFPELAQTVVIGEPTRLLEHVSRLAALADFEVLVHKAWQQPGFESDGAIAIRLNALPLAQPIVEQPAQSWTPPRSATHGGFDAGWAIGGAPPPSLQQSTARQSAISNAERPVVAQAAADGSPAVATAVTDDDLSAASTLITHALDGTLTLVRSRFLHVYTDLVYTIPSGSLPQAIRRQPLRKAIQTTTETIEVGSGAFGPEPQVLTMQSFPVRYHRRMRSNELHYIDHPLLGILILVTRAEVDASELTE